MPPAPTDVRGRRLDDKGRSVDAHGRLLDSLGRPISQRVIETITRREVPGFPTVSVGYPSFGDWVAMYDPRENRDFQRNQTTFFEFRQRHEKVMLAALSEIVARSSGKALLEQTASGNAARTITIMPMDFVATRKKWVKYHSNAISSADAVDSAAIGMYARTAGDGSNLTGSGLGAGSEIFFSPERLRSTGPGMKPDEVLFHEMVHSVRAMQGVRTLGFKMGGGYDNEEEFAAVVITNVYLSEKKQTALRANHGSKVLANPDKFLDSPDVPPPGARMLLNGMRHQQSGLFAALAKIDARTAAFNPFRQLAAETGRANAAHEAKMRAFDRQH